MFHASLQFWARVSVLTVMAILAVYLLPLATPFILSLVLTLLLWPLVNWIEDTGKRYMPRQWMPRWLAIIPAFLLFGLAVTLILQFIFIPFVAQFTGLVNNVPYIMSQVIVLFSYIQERYFDIAMPPQMLNIVNTTLVRLGTYSIDIAQRGIQVIFSLAGFLVELLLVPVLTFYMIKDGRRLSEVVVRQFDEGPQHHLRRIIHQMYHTLSGYIRGELFLAINMFVIVFIGLTLFGVPYPLVLALLAAFAEWIPIVGPLFGATPAVILAALISLPLAVKVGIFYLVVQLLDGQVIMPKVFGRFIHLHPLVIIAVIFVGGTLYGVKGMMLAVPVTAILQIFARELWNLQRIRKGEQPHERSQ